MEFDYWAPGGRKEKQIETEFEVAQVRDRDDTWKRGLKDNFYFFLLLDLHLPSTISVVTTKMADARMRSTRIESRILRLNAGLYVGQLLSFELSHCQKY